MTIATTQDAATTLVIGLMIHDPKDPYRQGYSLANALYAAHQQYQALNKMDMFIVAERVLDRILENPEQFPGATLSIRPRSR